MDMITSLMQILGGEKSQAFAEILETLSKNSFDIKKTLQTVTPEDLARILQSLSEKNENKKAASVQTTYGLSPIADIADKEIIYALNRYTSEKLY